MKNLPIYHIRVQGKLDVEWSGCFNGMDIEIADCDPTQTIISGPVRDQAALRGLMNKLWDLNLELISVNLI